VAEGTDEDTPTSVLQTALERLGGMKRFVKPGQTVAIKPNATWAFPPKTASSTDPEFLKAVIQAVKDAGAGRIIVMDHCSIEPGAEEALRESGIGKVVKTMGVEGIFPDRHRASQSVYTIIDLPNGRANQTMRVIKAATEADVRINLAVAKSHNVTKLTMCLKHMMGFLQFPGSLHGNLNQGIADINTPSAIQAQLHILEAIRIRLPHGDHRSPAGVETDSTHPEIVSRRNTVIAGVDPVLIDSYGCLRFYDTKPRELAHLLRAYESGCGELDVDTAFSEGRIRLCRVGEPILENTASASGTAGWTPQSPTSKPTATDASVSQSVGRSDSMSTADEANCPTADRVIDPSPFLNAVLFPIAVILTGIGLAILNRMRARLPRSPSNSGNEQTRQHDPRSEKRRG
jgi:hypothetical protein